jgi:hypothetical protein
MSDEKTKPTFRRPVAKPAPVVGNYYLEMQLRHQRQEEEREAEEANKSWLGKLDGWED